MKKNIRYKRKRTPIALKGSSLMELFDAVKEILKENDLDGTTVFVDAHIHQHRRSEFLSKDNPAYTISREVQSSIFLNSSKIEQFTAPNGEQLLSKIRAFFAERKIRLENSEMMEDIQI